MSFVRQSLAANNALYAPTFFELRRHLKEGVPRFKKKTQATQIRNKGKFYDAEFERELAWLKKKLQQESDPAPPRPTEDAESGDEECEDGLECACCYCKYSFVRPLSLLQILVHTHRK